MRASWIVQSRTGRAPRSAYGREPTSRRWREHTPRSPPRFGSRTLLSTLPGPTRDVDADLHIGPNAQQPGPNARRKELTINLRATPCALRAWRRLMKEMAMKTYLDGVTKSYWLVIGAAALVVAGCASTGISHNGPSMLTGAQQVPPVATRASGTADITVDSFKCPAATSSSNCPEMFGTVSTAGIDPTGVQIRQGAPGQQGPVIVSLAKTRDNTWSVPPSTTLTSSQYDAFEAGHFYVN